jgi:uncharacterized protein
MADELPILTPAEARILGCLIEKKELTPDIYPLTLNAAQAAANQKTSRDPVMSLDPGEVQRAFNLLEQKGLVRRSFASRVERYEHQMAQRFSLSRSQTALIGLLLLRGPQTAFELLSRTERMAAFASIEALRADLDLLIGRRPPMVKEIGRAPGQREDRFAHLLSGDVVAAAIPEPRAFAPVAAAPSELEERVKALEEQLAELRARLEAIGG